MRKNEQLAGLTREQLLVVVREQGRLLEEQGIALTTAQAKIEELATALEEVRQRGGGGGGPVKTAANSSVPPGKSWRAGRREREDGEALVKRGPVLGHLGVTRPLVSAEQVERFVACRPSCCHGCGEDLAGTAGRVVGQRQVIELPPCTPIITEAQLLVGCCPHCHTETAGSYPDGFRAPTQFGPRVTALAALLHEEHHVAYARMADLFRDAFGLRISEGALVAAVGRLGVALQPTAEVIAEEVRTAPVVGSDETGARVDGATWWEWVFQTATAAFHTIVRRRNTAVVLTFLDGAIPAVWISDLWKPQLAAPAVRYQICLAHQLRDLEYARQGGHGLAREWARAMDALLRWVVRLCHHRAQSTLSPHACEAQIAAIHHATDHLLACPLPTSWSADLQARFRLHRSALLTCLDDPAVPPTNNASERSLRPSVIHRKVTGGFRSEHAAAAYAATRTVSDTARKRGQNIFTIFLDALAPLPSPT